MAELTHMEAFNFRKPQVAIGWGQSLPASSQMLASSLQNGSSFSSATTHVLRDVLSVCFSESAGLSEGSWRAQPSGGEARRRWSPAEVEPSCMIIRRLDPRFRLQLSKKLIANDENMG